jgi:hypothetical protein
MVLAILIVLIAHMVLTYGTVNVLLNVGMVCSQMLMLPQQFVILVTLLVLAVLLMLTTVDAVLKVCTSITTLVSTHVQKDIMLIH